MSVIFDRIYDTPSVDKSIKKEFTSNNYRSENRYHLVVDNVTVGGLDICPAHFEGLTGNHIMIYCLEVYSPFRNMGYGKIMLRECEKMCINRGVTIMGLNVVKSNQYALRLYEGFGFEIIKELDGFKPGEYGMRKFYVEGDKEKYLHPSRWNPRYNR